MGRIFPRCSFTTLQTEKTQNTKIYSFLSKGIFKNKNPISSLITHEDRQFGKGVVKRYQPHDGGGVVKWQQERRVEITRNECSRTGKHHHILHHLYFPNKNLKKFYSIYEQREEVTNWLLELAF